jgi:hypothetical protein
MTSVIRHYRFRSCKRKNQYQSLKAGLDIVLEKRKRGIDVDSIYQCVFCRKFHIVHYPKQSHRKVQRKIISTLLNGGNNEMARIS